GRGAGGVVGAGGRRDEGGEVVGVGTGAAVAGQRRVVRGGPGARQLERRPGRGEVAVDPDGQADDEAGGLDARHITATRDPDGDITVGPGPAVGGGDDGAAGADEREAREAEEDRGLEEVGSHGEHLLARWLRRSPRPGEDAPRGARYSQPFLIGCGYAPASWTSARIRTTSTPRRRSPG